MQITNTLYQSILNNPIKVSLSETRYTARYLKNLLNFQYKIERGNSIFIARSEIYLFQPKTSNL